MKKETDALIIGKKLELNRDKNICIFMTFFLSVIGLGLFLGDLFRLYYANESNFVPSLSFLLVIVIFCLIAAVSYFAETKNPPYSLVIYPEKFVITYKNGHENSIDISDITEVFVEVFYGKVSTSYLTIKTQNGKTIIETICIDTVVKLVQYLKSKNVVIHYSNDLVKMDIEKLSDKTSLFNKVFMMIMLVFGLIFFGWIVIKCLYHYGVI